MITKPIFANVKSLLETNSALKDNDRLLMVNYWISYDLPNVFIDNPSQTFAQISMYDFFSLYIKAKLTNMESIRRTRQMVQQIHPNLRGLSYSKRQKHAKDVKSVIRHIESLM